MKEKVPFIKRHKKMMIGAVLVALLGIGGNYYVKKSTEKKPVSTASIIDSLIVEEEAQSDGNGPVATVNEQEISRIAYQNKLLEITNALIRLGFNTNNTKIAAEIRQQAIAELINFELLYQAATADGYGVTKEDVEAEYQNILTDMGSEEVLLLTLQDRNLTTADLLADIKKQLVVIKYIEEKLDLSAVRVESEEALAYYDQIIVTNPELPSFETIEADLIDQLIAEQQQQLVTDFVQVLRETATIETLI